jgi:chemotaxis protein methyltransferase CheR
MERFLMAVSINVTAMFRDPEFYTVFRKKVIPILRSLPFIRIWHAGCSTGEEVYSMAILLKEEGLYDKTRIYATDMNEEVLDKAKCCVFPLESMKEYTENYIKAGGKGPFSEYYSTNKKSAILSKDLQKNITWAQHNLVTDHSFNEFDVIFCRNVMIYFNKSLQDQVHKLMYESLAISGFLGLGNAESIRLTTYENCYEELDNHIKLFRKVK